MRIARETTQIFVPLAQKLGIEALEYELLRLSVQFLFPQQLLRVPYGLELLGHWARLFLLDLRREEAPFTLCAVDAGAAAVLGPRPVAR